MTSAFIRNKFIIDGKKYIINNESVSYQVFYKELYSLIKRERLTKVYEGNSVEVWVELA